MSNTESSLSKQNLWNYTLGAVGRDTASFMFAMYLMAYITFTKSLDDLMFAVISIVMVVVRILDGLTDPLMGNIVEVTRTRWGKYKPWFLAGMLGSASVILVSFINSADGWDYVALFIILYVVYSIVFKMNDIAYFGMLPSLADKKADRDLLTSRTLLFAGIGQAISSLVVPTFTTGSLVIGGSAVNAYAILAVLFCLIFIGMQLITLFGVKEKPLPPKGNATVNSINLKTIWETVKNNDQLVWCIVIFLCQTVSAGLISTIIGMSYIYFEFGYNGLLFVMFSALGGVAAGAVMLFFAPIAKRFTRSQLIKLSIICILGGSVFMLLTGLLVPGGASGDTSYYIKFFLMMFGNLFAFAGQNIFYLIIVVCIANTVEYNEWKTGVRAEGIIFSVRPLIIKIGAAAMQGIVLIALLVTGVRDFTNSISALEQSASKGLISEAERIAGVDAIRAEIPFGKTAALLVCITVLPSLLALGAYYVFSRKFTITEQQYDRILKDLQERADNPGQL